MAGASDTPLLTIGQVQKWEARRAELLNTVRSAEAEIASLNVKLEAARIFLPIENGHAAPVAKAPNEELPATESTGDAIVRVVGRIQGGALPGRIKEALIADKFDMSMLNANPAYLYTLLGRLVKRGRLEKRRNGLYRVPSPPSSPEGETGALGAPAHH